jgi:hypothetical protein
MTTIRSIAIAIAVIATVIPGNALAGDSQCRHSASEYRQAIAHFEGQVAKARATALANPLYESDAAYYASVLADARNCLRSLAPVTTASR